MGSNASFTSKLNIKNGPLDGRKITKIIKTAKWDKSHQKINIKK